MTAALTCSVVELDRMLCRRGLPGAWACALVVASRAELYGLLQHIRINEGLSTFEVSRSISKGLRMTHEHARPPRRCARPYITITMTTDDHESRFVGVGAGQVMRCRSSVGGHSHDAADQVDDVLEADAAGRRALLISLAVLAVTAAIQAVVVVLSGSVALLGDTLHNVADALTAVPLLIAFRLARRPPTKRYTYGYGRAEDLGGLFVIAMIALSSVLAAYEAIDRLIHPRHGHSPVGRRGRGGRRVHRQRMGCPATGSGSVGGSAAPRWSPTACMPAPTGSPAWRCCSARPASRWAGGRPTRSSGW